MIENDIEEIKRYSTVPRIFYSKKSEASEQKGKLMCPWARRK